jgi:subtilisin family serine protease
MLYNDLKIIRMLKMHRPELSLDTFLVPQDERYNEQWGLSNNGQAVNGQFGTSGVDINAVNAWDISTGSNSVTVAVVDTGVDTTGIDLKDNIYVNSKEQLNGKDDDGNGLVDDVNGWNYANNNNSVYDDSVKDLHGTHVAGIIAAELNNGGVTGVAPKVKILPVNFI